MQLIQALPIDAETYVAEAFHRRIRPPTECPHCGNSDSLSALGYYERNLSRLVHGVICILIRRFCCRHGCGKTVSILPNFAQPYRVVQNQTIERFLGGAPYDASVMRWMGVLVRYRGRFVRWLPEIMRVTGIDLKRAPPRDDNALERWQRLVADYGDFGGATLVFVSIFQITFFGRYQCHYPNPPPSKRSTQLVCSCLGETVKRFTQP